MLLTEDVERLLEGRPGTYGIYARNLRTDEVVAVAPDAPMDTASAAKTFILVHYAQLVTAGTCDPDERVTIRDVDHALGSGVVRYLAPGLQLTHDDLAYLMIIVSDNVATDVLLRDVGGPDAVNKTMAGLGLPSAQVNPRFSRSNTTEFHPFGASSARNLAEVYTHLDDRCRKILFRQQFVEGLPRHLPHVNQAQDWGISMPVRVYNKTGGDPGVYADAGLFETDDVAWVAAFLASGLADLTPPEGVGPTTAGAVNKLLYDAWAT